jgi:uncharacterized integral membrane protein
MNADVKDHLYSSVFICGSKFMKSIANLLTSLILAGWIGAIAILSIQNITSVSLKFLAFETIQLPVGIVLAFSVGVGAIGGAILPVLWQSAGRQRVQYEDQDY